MNLSKKFDYLISVVPGGAGGGGTIAPTDFDRSLNPISTGGRRGADYGHQIILTLMKFPLHGCFCKQNLGTICSTDKTLTRKVERERIWHLSISLVGTLSRGTDGRIPKVGIFQEFEFLEQTVLNLVLFCWSTNRMESTLKKIPRWSSESTVRNSFFYLIWFMTLGKVLFFILTVQKLIPTSVANRAVGIYCLQDMVWDM